MGKINSKGNENLSSTLNEDQIRKRFNHTFAQSGEHSLDFLERNNATKNRARTLELNLSVKKMLI